MSYEDKIRVLSQVIDDLITYMSDCRARDWIKLEHILIQAEIMINEINML